MKHNIWFEKKTEILHIQFIGKISVAEMNNLLDSAKTLFKGSKTRHLLIDLSSHSPVINKEVRRIINKRTLELKVTKHAFVGANTSSHMMAKVILITTGQAKTARFFNSNREAINWLQQDQL